METETENRLLHYIRIGHKALPYPRYNSLSIVLFGKKKGTKTESFS